MTHINFSAKRKLKLKYDGTVKSNIFLAVLVTLILFDVFKLRTKIDIQLTADFNSS